MSHNKSRVTSQNRSQEKYKIDAQIKLKEKKKYNIFDERNDFEDEDFDNEYEVTEEPDYDDRDPDSFLYESSKNNDIENLFEDADSHGNNENLNISDTSVNLDIVNKRNFRASFFIKLIENKPEIKDLYKNKQRYELTINDRKDFLDKFFNNIESDEEKRIIITGGDNIIRRFLIINKYLIQYSENNDNDSKIKEFNDFFVKMEDGLVLNASFFYKDSRGKRETTNSKMENILGNYSSNKITKILLYILTLILERFDNTLNQKNNILKADGLFPYLLSAKEILDRCVEGSFIFPKNIEDLYKQNVEIVNKNLNKNEKDIMKAFLDFFTNKRNGERFIKEFEFFSKQSEKKKNWLSETYNSKLKGLYSKYFHISETKKTDEDLKYSFNKKYDDLYFINLLKCSEKIKSEIEKSLKKIKNLSDNDVLEFSLFDSITEDSVNKYEFIWLFGQNSSRFLPDFCVKLTTAKNDVFILPFPILLIENDLSAVYIKNGLLYVMPYFRVVQKSSGKILFKNYIDFFDDDFNSFDNSIAKYKINNYIFGNKNKKINWISPLRLVNENDSLNLLNSLRSLVVSYILDEKKDENKKIITPLKITNKEEYFIKPYKNSHDFGIDVYSVGNFTPVPIEILH
ncbi:MAG TPA: hypothetical protein PLO89_06470 [Spirochaetota bacterium]|nr:hypothetical protein [Spirochaetota bacterium]